MLRGGKALLLPAQHVPRLSPRNISQAQIFQQRQVVNQAFARVPARALGSGFHRKDSYEGRFAYLFTVTGIAACLGGMGAVLWGVSRWLPAEQEFEELMPKRLYRSYSRGDKPLFSIAHGLTTKRTLQPYKDQFLTPDKSRHWPTQILPNSFPSASLIYPRFQIYKFAPSIQSLCSAEAATYLNSLAIYLEEHKDVDQIVLISFSYGSLITIEMIRQAVQLAKAGASEEIGNLLSKIKGIIFFCPPFGGSRKAWFTSLVPFMGPSIPTLSSGNAALKDLIEESKLYLNGQPICTSTGRILNLGIHTYTIAESKKTFPSGMLVDQTSATELPASSGFSSAFGGDHFSTPRLDSESDTWKRVLHFINMVLDHNKSAAPIPRSLLLVSPLENSVTVWSGMSLDKLSGTGFFREASKCGLDIVALAAGSTQFCVTTDSPRKSVQSLIPLLKKFSNECWEFTLFYEKRWHRWVYAAASDKLSKTVIEDVDVILLESSSSGVEILFPSASHYEVKDSASGTTLVEANGTKTLYIRKDDKLAPACQLLPLAIEDPTASFSSNLEEFLGQGKAPEIFILSAVDAMKENGKFLIPDRILPSPTSLRKVPK